VTEDRSRRAFVVGFLTAPVALLIARATGALRATASAMRPRASGTSALRCAVCGSARHAMLACPRLPEVR
jgi:hypothetical protein